MKRLFRVGLCSIFALMSLTACSGKEVSIINEQGENSMINFADHGLSIDPDAYQKDGYIFLGCYAGQTTETEQIIDHKGKSRYYESEDEVPSTIYALYEKIEDIMCVTFKADNFTVGSQSTKTVEFTTHPALAEYIGKQNQYAIINMNFLHFEHVADIAGVGFYNFTNYKILVNDKTSDEGHLRSSYKSMTFTQMIETTTQDLGAGLKLQIKSPDSNYSTKSAEYTNLVAKAYFGDDQEAIMEQHQYENLGGDPMKFNVQNPSMVVNMGDSNESIDFFLPWNAKKKLSTVTDPVTIKFSVDNYGRKLLLMSNWAYIKFTVYDELGMELTSSEDYKMENNGDVKATVGSFKVENPSQIHRIGISFWRTSKNASTMFYYVHTIALTIG